MDGQCEDKQDSRKVESSKTCGNNLQCMCNVSYLHIFALALAFIALGLVLFILVLTDPLYSELERKFSTRISVPVLYCLIVVILLCGLLLIYSAFRGLRERRKLEQTRQNIELETFSLTVQNTVLQPNGRIESHQPESQSAEKLLKCHYQVMTSLQRNGLHCCFHWQRSSLQKHQFKFHSSENHKQLEINHRHYDDSELPKNKDEKYRVHCKDVKDLQCTILPETEIKQDQISNSTGHLTENCCQLTDCPESVEYLHCQQSPIVQGLESHRCSTELQGCNCICDTPKGRQIQIVIRNKHSEPRGHLQQDSLPDSETEEDMQQEYNHHSETLQHMHHHNSGNIKDLHQERDKNNAAEDLLQTCLHHTESLEELQQKSPHDSETIQHNSNATTIMV